MQRTQISLTENDRSLLDAESARTGKSISALIREAVVQVYGHQKDTYQDLQIIDTALGCWNNREMSGAEYVEKLRSGKRIPTKE